MIRRNGKQTSCEPCRIAKVRCDHAMPVCRRCQSRNNSSQCYYHPAPLTKPKGLGLRSRPDQRRATARWPRQGVLVPSPATTPITSPSDHSQFLGSTSYLSVFKEAPLVLTQASHRSLYPEFEQWRTDHAYASARLVRLLSALPFYLEQISWYYQRGRFTIIPAPIMLDSLARAVDSMKISARDATEEYKSIYNDMTTVTATPLIVSPNMSPSDFYSSFIGPRLRLEFVGLIFALCGIVVQGRYTSEHVLDLGTGENMTAETFTKDMMLACNACIENCKQHGHINDLTIWMRYMHVILGSEVLGETSERVYSLFGDVVSNIYAMGLHHQPPQDVPFFLAETRKRLLAVCHRTDKNMSTLLGRPPRLPHQYCDAALPLDLADEDLFLSPVSLEQTMHLLDEHGWNQEDKLHPATVMRMRQILSTLREQVLELSLERRKAGDYGDRLLKTVQSCQEVPKRIPARLRYDPARLESADAVGCLARIIIHLEFLLSVLQLHRIRCQGYPEAIGDLLDTSLQVLAVIMNLTRHFDIHAVQKQLPWIILIYGIPAAGVLVTELHAHTLSQQPLPLLKPRSEIIRSLSVFVSWCQTSDMPSSITTGACVELSIIIGRLLDDALNHRPVLAVQSEHASNGTVAPVLDNGQERHLATDLGFPSEFISSGVASEEFLSWLDDLDFDFLRPGTFI